MEIRKQYYSLSIIGKIGAVILGGVDWLFPDISRHVIGVKPRVYPISVALESMIMDYGSKPRRSTYSELFQYLRVLAVINTKKNSWSWGLGFPWMSKNGLYGPDIPFVTHTPYVMEALLLLADHPELHDDAMDMFNGTWRFLESLKIMDEDDQALALSYAPVEEPRIVVNANSYAAYAYAMHFEHGLPERKEMAREKAHKLVRWVIRQQSSDGSWLYYADDEPGNFIDCFHSCFVVKNLLKVKKIFPELSGLVDPAIDRGWRFIRENFPDAGSGLCRRFIKRAQRDPFRWDLYDQAEYLGLLVDFGQWDEAREFAAFVERRFRNGGHWYCRIDLFGRRWGRDFLRWGIVPFWYHKARLDKALEAH